MKNIALLIFVCYNFLGFSQIYMTKTGSTKFVSEAPLELIKAQTDKTTGVLDISTKSVAFSIPVETFEGFNSGLQKEHFKENYMETSKYKNATFKGKVIEDLDYTKNGTFPVRVKGVFNIHGTEKEKIVKGKITIKDNTITIEANFDVPLEDHNIKVPKIVNQKIASIIMVDIKSTLIPKA